MSKYEKLGSFILFEKLEEDRLSKSFLAGQVVNNQIENMTVLKKFDHSLSTLPDFILDLNQEYEVVKALANPSIVKPSNLVQDRSEFAAVFDYVEGKTLRQTLVRCVQEGFPFTVDHSLLIGSRLCTALEYLHSKKVNDERLVHGFVCPETTIITYDGEIKLQYFGLAHALLKFPAGRDKFFHDYKNYLAPEVLDQQKIDRSSDVFGAGLTLYEMLTGESFFAKGRNVNPAVMIEEAQMSNNSGEKIPVPAEIKKVLLQSLAVDPSQRYEAIAEMRKALDLLLFSSEFSPTTFNLAFFMHSLFRDCIDEEAKNLNSYKKFDISTIIKEEPPPPPKPEHPVGATPAKDIPVGLSLGKEGVEAEPEMFGAMEPKERSKMPVFAGILVAIAVIGAIVFFALRPKSAPVEQAPPAGQTAEQIKAQQQERERLEAEAKAAQDLARQKDEELKALQDKLAQLEKAQQQVQKEQKTQADLAAIQQLKEQAQKLEEERKAQEAVAEEKKRQAAAAAAAPPAASTGQEKTAQLTPPAGTPAGGPGAGAPDAAPGSEAAPVAGQQPPTGQQPGATEQQPTAKSPEPATPPPPAVKEGDLVEPGLDVVKPSVTKYVQPVYPPIARARKIEGTVILNVLISERGDAIDVQVLREAGGSSGLNEAAVEAVKKWKFQPAVKAGKRVKIWMAIPIKFSVSSK